MTLRISSITDLGIEDKEMKNSDKSIVILSGGMDSVTTLAYASNKGLRIVLRFNYRQKSYSEINSTKYYANYYDCRS